MLARPAPHLDRQCWDPGKFTDIGGDHGEAVGNTGGRQPEVMRPDQCARRGESRPHLGMGAGRGEIHRQEGKTLQDSFDKGGPLRTDLRLHGAMHPMEQFTGRDDRQKEFFLLPLRQILLQIKPPPLRLKSRYWHRSRPPRIVDLRAWERLPCRCEVFSELRGFSLGEMGQRGQQRREFREPFPRRKWTEFRNGSVTAHEHETLATVSNTIDVLREVTSRLCDGKCLRHQRSSVQEPRIILSDVSLDYQ